MIINTIYPTFNGEVNPKGIGSPTIFVRTGGCHLRCYAKTLGILCDTPEALEKDSGVDMSMEAIFKEVGKLRSNTGIRYICLSGGDPMWRKQIELHDFFRTAEALGYEVTVETSGTLDVSGFLMYEHVSFILDYKLKSAGIDRPFVKDVLPMLRPTDFIKFVVYDEDDLQEMLNIVKERLMDTKASISAGVYWGGKMSTFKLFEEIAGRGYAGIININMQAHKLCKMAEVTSVSDIVIPREI